MTDDIQTVREALQPCELGQYRGLGIAEVWTDCIDAERPEDRMCRPCRGRAAALRVEAVVKAARELHPESFAHGLPSANRRISITGARYRALREALAALDPTEARGFAEGEAGAATGSGGILTSQEPWLDPTEARHG